MYKRLRLLMIITILLLIPLSSFSATIHVPADQPTIQAGIDAAIDGDTVLVSPGTFYESINFEGKLIVVKSIDGPINTIITNDPSSNLITFGNNEDESAILEGFTLQGGRIAVSCASAGPTIRYNLLVDQNITSWAAISLGQPGTLTNSAPANIQNNTIVNCANGGISSFSSKAPTIRNNILAFNNGYGLHVAGQPAPVNVLYNNIYGNGQDLLGDFTVTLGISKNPFLNEDFTLSLRSPCINAGDPDPLYNDPDGTRGDIGAFFYYLELPIAEEINFGPTAVWLDGFIVYTTEPEINWTYVDIEPTTQNQYQIQIGTDDEWSVVEVWDSGPVASSANSIIYNGPQLDGNSWYYLRVRVNNGINWGDWQYNRFYTYIGHVIEVPEDFRKIQDGIKIVHDGDTVLIASGIYIENLDLFNKNIVVKSEKGMELTFLRPLNWSIPIFTIGGNGSPTISGVTFENGGSIATLIINGSATVEHNTFRNNLNGIRINDGCPLIRYNLFYGNGGYTIELTDSARVINNTIDSNAWAIRISNSNIWARICNNIITNNSVSSIQAPYSWHWYYAYYNDIWNNGGGEQFDHINNLLVDPQYADISIRDYRLRPSSPCIDAGNPDPQYNDPDGSRNDMGAFPSLICGDINLDSDVNIADLIYLINYYFGGGPAPVSISTTDLSCDGYVNITDIVYLNNILFHSGTGGCCQ